MKKYHPFLFFLFQISCPLLVRAQEKKPEWIDPISEFITIKFTQSSEKEKFSLYTEDYNIHLSPNAKSISKLSFSYRFINFGFKFVPKFLPGNNDEDKKGSTKSGGFNFGFNFRHWLQEFSYSKTKGYYLENMKDFNPDWTTGEPYLQFPDLEYKNIQGITRYSFNRNFSVNAVATESERQLKSAGSFIPQIVYRYYTMDDRSEITENNPTQKIRNLELAFGAGYYYTFVFKKNFYFSVGITPSIGYLGGWITNRFTDQNMEAKEDNLLLRVSGRAGLGYNSQRFFAGIYSRALAEKFKQSTAAATTHDQSLDVELFLGYRLKSPKWLQNSFQNAINKMQSSFPLK